MEYRKLGESGLKVSEVGLGGASFGGMCDEKESLAVIHRALDLGVNLIDTADVYGMGGESGRCEEYVGKAVKDHRSQVVLSSKFGGAMGKGPNDSGASRFHIMQAVEASLKRLDTGYIDLYYIHHPDRTTPIEETLRAMDDLIRSGKVRYLGCCNFPAWQICEAIWTSRMNHLEQMVVAQSAFNLIDRRIKIEVIPCCQALGIGLVTYWPLAEGFLTGKYQRGQEGAAVGRLSDPRFKRMADTLLLDKNYDVLEKLQVYVNDRGRTLVDLAFAWVLAHPFISSTIVAATKPEQVSANVAAADWKLTAQELAEIEELLPPVPGEDYLGVTRR